MKRFPRSLVALLLTAVYAVIVMAPLAPIAMRSAAIAHAITGECVEDCAICGCSPERSASRTCCCWQKKLKHEHDLEREEGVADCCKKKQRSSPRLTCSTPCGSKPFVLWGAEKFEQLPYHFNAAALVFHEDLLAAIDRNRLTDRHGDPPDPPPKLIPLS